jgi:hypothetical protein
MNKEIGTMLKKFMVVFAFLSLVSTVSAEGIPVEPGLWEMTSTVNMPMMPQPRVTTMTECMDKSEISMDDLGSNDMGPDCKFAMDQLDGNTMQWSVDCPVEGGTSHGEWQATSAGDSVTGEGKITMSFQGQTMEMTMNWSGRRISACD